MISLRWLFLSWCHGVWGFSLFECVNSDICLCMVACSFQIDLFISVFKVKWEERSPEFRLVYFQNSVPYYSLCCHFATKIKNLKHPWRFLGFLAIVCAEDASIFRYLLILICSNLLELHRVYQLEDYLFPPNMMFCSFTLWLERLNLLIVSAANGTSALILIFISSSTCEFW